MFVKICGVTTPSDAVDAVDAGADAIGVNFSAISPRRVDPQQAVAIVEAVSGTALVVGVFRDHLVHEVTEIVASVGLGAVQLHGSESPEMAQGIRRSVPILFRAMAAGDPAVATIDAYRADVVLLDAPAPGGGVPFDWTLVGDLGARHRLLLAGGLRPDNVASAVSAVKPWGVDVATGVESSPGRKDRAAMAAFVAAARAAADYDDPHPPLKDPA